MTFGDIIKKSLDYAGLTAEVTVGGVIDTANPIVIDLVKCANTVYALYSSQYGLYRKTDYLTPVNNIISFERFSKRVNSIISIKADGVNLKFRVTVSGVTVETAQETAVEYDYYPTELGYNDNIFLIDYINEYTLPFMILSEYFTKTGQYEKAKLFYDKFNIFVEDVKNKRHLTLKVDRWL